MTTSREHSALILEDLGLEDLGERSKQARDPSRTSNCAATEASSLSLLSLSCLASLASLFPGLVGSPIVAADDAVELFAALRVWSGLVDDVGNQLGLRLEPGDLAVFDNHRMLHGRTSFELGPGQRRHLLGCYLELDELRNRRALLRRADCG